MSSNTSSRRTFLQLAAGAGLVPGAFAGPVAAAEGELATLTDGILTFEFDGQMRSRLSRAGLPGAPALTDWSDGETLALAGGAAPAAFRRESVARERIDTAHGAGVRLTLGGVTTAAPLVRKRVVVELYERYPGFAFLAVSWENASGAPLHLGAWTSAAHEVLAEGQATPAFWTYSGSTHPDRRDWIRPVLPGFAQDNALGMTASDYGGGVPVSDVWRRDAGVAVGHLEPTPRTLSLPVAHGERGARIAIRGAAPRVLAPGARFTTPQTFVAVHVGDCFRVLDTYRRVMAEEGVCPAKPPPAAYEPIWCAWGYERECTVPLIEGTLPKVRELGLRWAVVDDGWQDNVGDWGLDRDKYPAGDADMQRLTGAIRAHDLKPRLWIAPLAAAPGSDVLHDHTDMLLLAKDGAPQLVSWWNSFYLCPAYPKTREYFKAIVRRILGTWGYAGLKIDGQHLNAVAPCYNPAHHHARPEESVEGLQDFFRALYDEALSIDPGAVMELCPCGTGFSFFNLEYANQSPAADPESSRQVRQKGKALKALLGPGGAFAGDHVELSDGHDDFASTVGIGAVVSTKFTWPVDPKPKDSFLLTPAREALWRRWIAIYNDKLLSTGLYRGELYDIGFDVPECHVVEKAGTLHYAFYARTWRGPVTLRGLEGRRYRLRDYFHDRDLGEVTGPRATLELAFERFLVLEAVPA